MNDSTPAWLPHIAEGAPVHLDLVPRSLQSYLDEAADRFGDHKAVIFQNLTLTYRQLKDKAEAFAASLRERGLNTGDRVAIMLPNLPQTIIAFWGALKAGATVVMTNPLYMEKELTHHFSDSTPKFLITLDLFWSKIEPLLPRLGVQTCVVTRVADALAFPLNLLQPLQAKRQGHLPEVKFDNQSVVAWKNMLKTARRYSEEPENPAHTLALLQYTGGTTGFSKGGATREDVKLMRANCPASVKVKAAGGISSLKDAEDFIELGAERLGTSRIVKLAMELENEVGAPNENY